jgi:hypothetical protein
MLPAFVVPELKVRESGVSHPFALPAHRPETIFLTLGITHILEQQSLDVSLHGSVDALHWDPRPLLSFSQKFYCGTYRMLLDLDAHPDIRFLRAQWRVNRWGRGDLQPLFGFYLHAEEAHAHATPARLMTTSA